MPTEIYKTSYITSIDGTEIEIIPLKIKYLKKLMGVFTEIEDAKNEDEIIEVLVKCVFIALKQFTDKFKTLEDVEDGLDLKNIYDILRATAGIDLEPKKDESLEEKAQNKEGSVTWENLDLAKLETEVFLRGIWKNFEELETSISIEELMQILSVTRELDYEEKKFLAALQGINLDEGTDQERGQVEWENLKARVASNGATNDASDILALQGANARQVGFGIGYGLGYEDLRDKSVLKE
jgi:hypothetical protein